VHAQQRGAPLRLLCVGACKGNRILVVVDHPMVVPMRHPPPPPNPSTPPSSEFLGVYQDAVLELQRQLLQQPAAGLATLQYQLLSMQARG